MALSTNVPKLMLLIAFGLISRMHALAQFQSLPDEPTALRQVEKVPKRDWIHLASEAYFAGGTVVDMKTTVDGLERPTNAYTTSGKFLMSWPMREAGWTRFVGDRNASGVASLNVLADLGVDLLSRRLYRGGHRRIAVLVLVAKATGHWYDGFNNMRALGGIDKRVQLQTGYQGAVVWR
ncbi:MAG TPA: hypothetical protein VIJ29_04325 [Candidatus Paceibacterota bacterium]